VATGKKRGPARAVGSGILALAFSPDGRRLAAGCLDRGLYLLDEEFVPKFESLTGHAPREAWAVAFFPGGKTLVSAGDDHAGRLWEVATGRQAAPLQDHEMLASCVAVAPDGKRIASGSYDQTVKVSDAATGKPLFTGKHNGHVRSVVFSPDGRLLA